MTQAEIDVLAERQRQIEIEGWTVEHDDEFRDGQLAQAAACYAANVVNSAQVHLSKIVGKSAFFGWPLFTEPGRGQIAWPWESKWWKPKDCRRDLVRSAALIIAEIDRRDRLEGKS